MRSIGFHALGMLVASCVTEGGASPLGDLTSVTRVEVSRRGQLGYATVVSPPTQVFPDSAVRSLLLPPEEEADI